MFSLICISSFGDDIYFLMIITHFVHFDRDCSVTLNTWAHFTAFTLSKRFELFLPDLCDLFSTSCLPCRVNVGCGPAEERVLLTGLHAVADIYCENCKTTLGWKYVSQSLLKLPVLMLLDAPLTPAAVLLRNYAVSWLPRGQIMLLQVKRTKLLSLKSCLLKPWWQFFLLTVVFRLRDWALRGLLALKIITVPKGWLQTARLVPLRVYSD